MLPRRWAQGCQEIEIYIPLVKRLTSHIFVTKNFLNTLLVTLLKNWKILFFHVTSKVEHVLLLLLLKFKYFTVWHKKKNTESGWMQGHWVQNTWSPPLYLHTYNEDDLSEDLGEASVDVCFYKKKNPQKNGTRRISALMKTGEIFCRLTVTEAIANPFKSEWIIYYLSRLSAFLFRFWKKIPFDIQISDEFYTLKKNCSTVQFY